MQWRHHQQECNGDGGTTNGDMMVAPTAMRQLHHQQQCDGSTTNGGWYLVRQSFCSFSRIFCVHIPPACSIWFWSVRILFFFGYREMSHLWTQ